jgi:hypothetical protein
VLLSSWPCESLRCARNCRIETSIEQPIFASCNTVDRPATEHSCEGILEVDFTTGIITGYINATSPPSPFNVDVASTLSLGSDSALMKVEFDCVHEDNCDQTFARTVLAGDWIRLKNIAVASIRIFENILFNASAVQRNETCEEGNPCSGNGFCKADFRFASNEPEPVFDSFCSNVLERPPIDWIQAYDQQRTGDVLLYTCNTPACATKNTAWNIRDVCRKNLIPPFEVVIPPMPTSGATTSSMVSMGFIGVILLCLTSLT